MGRKKKLSEQQMILLFYNFIDLKISGLQQEKEYSFDKLNSTLQGNSPEMIKFVVSIRRSRKGNFPTTHTKNMFQTLTVIYPFRL